MSWNPFNKLMAPKKSTSKAFEDNDLDVRVQQVVLIEQAMKKLHKDTKKSVESSSALSKVEQRMMFELLNGAKSIKDAEMLAESAEKLTNVSCQTEDSQSQRNVIIRCIIFLVYSFLENLYCKTWNCRQTVCSAEYGILDTRSCVCKKCHG